MKARIGHKTNWPVVILLILGLSTIVFPLYMAIVIAFKQPSEMTNSISGIKLELKQLCGSHGSHRFLALPWEQHPDHRCDSRSLYPDPFSDGLRDWTEPCTQ